MSYDGGGGILPFNPPSKITGAVATKQFRGSARAMGRRIFIASPAMMSNMAKRVGTPQIIMMNSRRVTSKWRNADSMLKFQDFCGN